MKERVYGWFPPATDIYSNRGPHNKYQKECLYKFRNTMHESKQVAPPSPNLMVRGYSPAPPSMSRPTTATDNRPAKTPPCPSRPKTAPVPKFKLIPRLQIPTPSQCWATNVPETDYNITAQSQNDGGRPSTASTQISWPVPVGLKPDMPKTTHKVTCTGTERSQISWPRPKEISKQPAPQDGLTSKRERIKSASVCRERTPLPSRPVKSAGPVRSPMPTATPTPEVQSPVSVPEPEAPVPRPPNPVQVYRADVETKAEEEEEESYELEVAREKYGWMAEVHGNPYGYKKIPKRPCYSVKCKEPEVAPEAPPVHMENMETFFYNTIPRRPMTFTVHKEWISEVLHAKRLELQKRIGMNYRWKNFAFVY